MNIFYLDSNPKTCAEMHHDKHCSKMLVEYAQLMSTAHRVLDGVEYTDRTLSGRRIQRWHHNNDDLLLPRMHPTPACRSPEAPWSSAVRIGH